MEQLQQLLEILKDTPEMALWGLALYFLFILLQLASWVYALKLIAQQFIKRYFDYRDKSLNSKRGVEIAEMFEKQKISNVDYNLLIELLNSVKKNSNYLHESDIRSAINKLK
jgi:C4-dicarboxylate transporter